METQSTKYRIRPPRIVFLAKDERAFFDSISICTIMWGGIYNLILDPLDLDIDMILMFDPDLIVYTDENLVGSIDFTELNIQTVHISSLTSRKLNGQVVPLFVDISGILKELQSTYLVAENLDALLASFYFGIAPSNEILPGIEEFSESFSKPISDYRDLLIKEENSNIPTLIELTKSNLVPHRKNGRKYKRTQVIYYGDPNDLNTVRTLWNFRSLGHLVFLLSSVKNDAIPFFKDWLEIQKLDKSKIVIFGRESSFPLELAVSLRQANIEFEYRIQALFENIEFWRGNDYSLQESRTIGFADQRSFEFEVIQPNFFSHENYVQTIGIDFDLPYAYEHSKFMPSIPKIKKGEWCYFPHGGIESSFFKAGKLSITKFDSFSLGTFKEFLPKPIDFWSRFFKEVHNLEIRESIPGRNIQSIINVCGSLHFGCRILKYQSTRAVLKELQNDKHKSLPQLQKTIGQSWKDDEVGFGLHHSTKESLLGDLIQRKIIRQGCSLTCSNCNNKKWYSILNIGNEWQCDFCYSQEQTPLLRDSNFAYKADGIFQLKNWGSGALTNVLVLWRFAHLADKISFIPSFDLVFQGSQKYECDLLVTTHDHFRSNPIVVESKSYNNFIQDDLDKTKIVGEMIGTGAYLCFATTRYEITEEEIELFRLLYKDYHRIIILTANELNPYDLFKISLGNESKSIHSVEDLSMATIWKYLSPDDLYNIDT